MRSRNDFGAAFFFLSRLTSTPGGGSGGLTPRNVSRNHLPRATGEVRAGADVMVTRAPFPRAPRNTRSAGRLRRDGQQCALSEQPATHLEFRREHHPAEL